MDNSNIKMYLAISGALIILLILIILIPISSKKTTTQDKNNSSNSQLFPTSIETNSTNSTDSTRRLTPIPADFTGALEEKIPQPIVDLAAQKKDLRSKVPLSLSTFTIDFDYAEDKFTVVLKDPKDQAQKEFDSWKTTNYPLLESSQFLLK